MRIRQRYKRGIIVNEKLIFFWNYSAWFKKSGIFTLEIVVENGKKTLKKCEIWIII